MRKIADLNFASAVLGWDQEVYMPVGSSDARAQQLGTLAGIAHELFTAPELGELLSLLEKDESLSPEEKLNIKKSSKDYKDKKKYTNEFVIELSRCTSEAFQAWDYARKNNDYNHFAPSLQKLIVLKQKETELLGYTSHPYDALLDQFEPGMTTVKLEKLFSEVKSALVPFVKEIVAKKPVDDSFLKQNYDSDKQWNFGIELLKNMNFDFNIGRQDISSHPFTTSFSSKDVRVTTRINVNDLREMIWSCIHEGGHALYEQGLPESQYGLPWGEASSLAVHESQSRIWENNVGRSLAYWKYHYADLQKIFPENLLNISLELFYKSINKVEPSFIRTAADELTYHFHIMIRYEMEKGIIEGSIPVNEIPKQWNAKYKEYLGIDVPTDALGVLQDIHWSHGGFGYFPTYSLGSFYAAQYFACAKKNIPGLLELIEKGDYKLLLDWLRKNIHVHGRLYTAEELCERITGETLQFKYFFEYAKEKFGNI